MSDREEKTGKNDNGKKNKGGKRNKISQTLRRSADCK